jgi:PPM family protein phosphatase
MNWRPAHLEVGARSETGYVRDENQDRMSGTRVPLGYLYIVADGMGGHKGGAVAAELTVQELQRSIAEAPVDAAVEKVIQTAFNKANDAVYQRAHAGDPTVEGMGSTAVLLLISGRVARVAHVGDSRAYLYRRGRLKQLTTDHTVVQKMVQAGMLKPNEAADHPNASVLDRAIGSKPNVLVDISEPWRLREGDAILLCSDGLSGYVPDAEVAAVLRSHAAVQEIPDQLMKLALQKGGEDNITVQFIQYGTRPETHRRAPGFLPPLFQMIAVFALGAVLSAAAFALYLPVVENGFKAKESTLITTLTQKQAELEETKVQLARVQNEQDIQRETSEKLTRAIEEKSRQVDDKDNTISEISKKLDDERGNSKKQRGITQNQPDKTRDELAAVKKKLKDTEQELATAKQELRKVRASLEANRVAKDRPKPPGEPEPKSTSGADTALTGPAPASEKQTGP